MHDSDQLFEDMTLWVDIYDKETGGLVRHTGDYIEHVGTRSDQEIHHDYTWSEGNYSCDCNRAIFSKVPVNENVCTTSRFLAVGSNNPLFDLIRWNEGRYEEI